MESGIDVTLLQSVENINSRQRVRLVDRLDATLGGLDGKHIAVWGLAYKPNTDDVREAPALEIVLELTKRGATVAAYDPVAVEQARLQLGDLCTYSPDAYSAVDAADALILATEWSEFRSPDVSELAKRMRRKVVFDGRNVFDPYVFTEADFHYEGIGRPGAGHGVGPR